jgi:hypothetical protein
MTPRVAIQLMSPTGLGTENDYAGGGQQQFTRPTITVVEQARCRDEYRVSESAASRSEPNKYIIGYFI